MMAWLNRQSDSAIYVTAISVAELLAGLAVMPQGKRKVALTGKMGAILSEFVNAILPFDDDAARVYAALHSKAKANRYTLPLADAQIAAIATVRGYAVAARDVKPFLAAGVPVINPWEE